MSQESTIIIREMQVQAPFMYLWLKHVVGVDLKEHCAKCLTGAFDDRLNSRTKMIRDLELPETPFHYLCGVSKPYCWAKNFHLGFRFHTGKILTIERHGIRLVLENAEEVTFSEADIDPADPHIRLKVYRTCRNWQFAHRIAPMLSME